MALYVKMLLINEQEYLTLKNARNRVGEPEGEEDEYARYHMGGDDEEYSEFGDDYSYYSDDDDDYGDDDIPPHPFRYDLQPTPHVEVPLAEEEVIEQDAEQVEQEAQENVEEVEQLVENAVEELHVAQENAEHAENDAQLEEAENRREEAVERLAAAEEQLDAADDVLADVAMAVPTPDESVHDPMSLQTAQYRPAPDDSEIDLYISDVRPEPAIAQDDPSTWQLTERLGKLWNPHGKTKQFTAAHDPFRHLKAKTPEPEIQSKFKQWQILKGKGMPMNTSLDVEYDPVNRSLEMIPHPQYPPPPSDYSEAPSEYYIGQTPPTSPEPIESILED